MLFRSRHWMRLLPAAAVVLLAGCLGTLRDKPTPIQAGYNPVELLEPVGEREADQQLGLSDLHRLSGQFREARRPAVLPPPKNVLCLSGGGSYGAYPAGVLYGWTKAGTRPTFDVVTGVSTGALIAPLAFIGSETDEELRQVYTTLRNNDVFRIRKVVRTVLLLSESLADNKPLSNMIERYITPDVLAKIAVGHAAGRRLYVGTTDLESRRPVYWDMGEIASRGTPDDLALFRRILLASAAIPGFFPPVRIPVCVDGQQLEELHTDGSVSNALFFRPPHLPPECRTDPNAGCLYGSNVYTLVAGKVYADPDRVRPRALAVASTAASALVYAETRGDLFKLYTACLLTGMNYHTAAIPAEMLIPFPSTDFKPAQMGMLFEAGMTWAMGGPPWRTTPPGLEPGEEAFLRTGTNLTRVPFDGTPPPINSTPRPRARRPEK